MGFKITQGEIMKTALLIMVLTTGCTSFSKTTVQDCIDQQIALYGDLCAESSSGYEDMTGSDGHFDGVKCAVESISACVADIEIHSANK